LRQVRRARARRIRLANKLQTAVTRDLCEVKEVDWIVYLRKQVMEEEEVPPGVGRHGAPDQFTFQAISRHRLEQQSDGGARLADLASRIGKVSGIQAHEVARVSAHV